MKIKMFPSQGLCLGYGITFHLDDEEYCITKLYSDRERVEMELVLFYGDDKKKKFGRLIGVDQYSGDRFSYNEDEDKVYVHPTDMTQPKALCDKEKFLKLIGEGLK